MSRFLMRPIAFAIATLCIASTSSAADVSQRFADANDVPLPNIEVQLLNADGVMLAKGTTGADGVAHFDGLPEGTYRIAAVRPDGTLTQSQLIVAVNAPAPTEAKSSGKAAKPMATGQVEPIVVTAQRFKEARIDISPKVGTTVYTVDKKLIDGLGQGDATAFDDVLEHLPGVDKDSKASGSLHVRDDHGDVQYRIDGVQLPESISGFGQSIDTRFVDSIDFLTGALPAQYGLRTAGVVDIQTKEGSGKSGGSVGLVVGSHDTVEPSAALFGSVGRMSYYLSGSYTGNDEGIENPVASRDALHDRTHQAKSFGDLSYFIDDTSRVGLLFGTYNGRFQIPNNPNQVPQYSLAGVSNVATGMNNYPSAQLNENQTEENRFAVLSYQKTLDDSGYQVSVFHQYSQLHFTPDPLGDLIYNGVASDSMRSNSATGLQLDGSYRINEYHTLRAGTEFTRQDTESNNSLGVFAADGMGGQTSNLPMTIIDDSGKRGQLTSYYVQDEWHVLRDVTVNYGLRYDHVAAFTDESQYSPRLNVSYKLTDDTAVHAGFSRYFTPPPQELASQSSIGLYTNTTAQPEVGVSDNVKAERTNYYDVGISQRVSPSLTLAADTYYKQIHNLLDEGQFGQALILSPFNYAQGYAKGLELSGTYTHGQWGGYLNFSYQKAQGKDIVSGQSLFAPGELVYIANNYTYLDHDQRFTVSGGASYHFAENTLSADVLMGSGLRRTPDGGDPNSSSLPSYETLNTTLSHSFKHTSMGDVEARLAILNVFDRSYLLRDGSGVGVGAPQYGARRTLYTGVTTTF